MIITINTNISNTDLSNTKRLSTDSNSFSPEKDTQSNSACAESKSFLPEKKTTPQKNTRQHSDKEMEDMLSRMPLRARVIANNLTGDRDVAENICSCFKYFLAKHRENIPERHKVLTDETIERIVTTLTEDILIDRDGYTDRYFALVTGKKNDDRYEGVIDEFFETDFTSKGRQCDYSIVYFARETVLTNLMNHMGKDAWCMSELWR